jgi:hypothetical protein
MPPAEFEPTIPASEWPQTHALDHADIAVRTLQRIIPVSTTKISLYDCDTATLSNIRSKRVVTS